jgi:hypothetical protein
MILRITVRLSNPRLVECIEAHSHLYFSLFTSHTIRPTFMHLALFINAQLHVHNVVASWDMSPQSPILKDSYIQAVQDNDKRMLNALAVSKKVCDRATAQLVARTTRILDFTGRTATIVFDFDGAFGSNYCELDS